MAAMPGANVDAILLAMVEKQGPEYQKALQTVGLQQGGKQALGAFLPYADFFPEGEKEQIRLKKLFGQYAESGKLNEFYDQYPEAEAAMLKTKWDNPEEMMKFFLRSNVWDKYNTLSNLDKDKLRETISEPDTFRDYFLSKETRNYDAISLETMVNWARQLDTTVPKNAPETKYTEPLKLSTPEEITLDQKMQQYYQWRSKQPGAKLSDFYFSLPEAMQDKYKAVHPELQEYFDARNIYLAEHPDMIPSLLGEDNELRTASPEVQLEVIQYRAEKARLFGGVDKLWNEYWSLGKKERAAFFKANPMMKASLDWQDAMQQTLSQEAFMFVASDKTLGKMRFGENYKEPYRMDFDKISPELGAAIARNVLLGKQLGDGANMALKELWISEGKPLTFEVWLKMVLDGYR